MFLLRLLFVGLVFSSVAPLMAGEDKDILPPGWKITTMQMPGFVFLGPEAVANGAVRIDHARGGSIRYDVREPLSKVAEVDFPPGAIAIYDERAFTLIVVAPEEIAQRTETFANFCGGGGPTQVRVVATLAEFETDRLSKTRDVPYDRLRSIAGNTWREVEQLTITSKSGQRAVARQRYGDEPREKRPPQELGEWTPPLAPGESGAAIEVEPVIGPDGQTVDLNVVWHRRFGQGADAEQLEATTSTVVTSGVPAVVSLWPAGGKGRPPANRPIRSLALVLRAEILNAEGVPVREAFADASRRIREKLKLERLKAAENEKAESPR